MGVARLCGIQGAWTGLDSVRSRVLMMRVTDPCSFGVGDDDDARTSIGVRVTVTSHIQSCTPNAPLHLHRQRYDTTLSPVT